MTTMFTMSQLHNLLFLSDSHFSTNIDLALFTSILLNHTRILTIQRFIDMTFETVISFSIKFTHLAQ